MVNISEYKVVEGSESQGAIYNGTLTFSLSKTPSKAIFVPTLTRWSGIESNKVTIQGTTVTVELRCEILITTGSASVGGYLLYI